MSLCVFRRAFSSHSGLSFLKSLINYEHVALPQPVENNVFPLERMRKLLKQLGDPQKDLRALQIVGSKGKGSVAAFAASFFASSGLKTGLYSSPHVKCITERISLSSGLKNDIMKPIQLQDLNNLILAHKSKIEALISGGQKVTYFEVLTALALVHFVRNGVDHVVVEMGFGGSADATNIFEDSNVDATIVCPIEKEHEEVFGTDLNQIVESEMECVSLGRPVVLSKQWIPEVQKRLLEICETRGCPVLNDSESISVNHRSDVETETSIFQVLDVRLDGQYSRNGEAISFEDIHSRMIGSHQRENIKTALMACHLLSKSGWKFDVDSTKCAIENTFLPGRFQILRSSSSEWFVLDGAHTQYACRAFVQTLKEVFPKVPFVFILAMMNDKKHTDCLWELLHAKPEMMIITAIQSNERSLPPGTLLAYEERVEADFKRKEPFRCRKTLTSNISTAMTKARDKISGLQSSIASGSKGVICVTGSLYAVREALQYLEMENIAGNNMD